MNLDMVWTNTRLSRGRRLLVLFESCHVYPTVTKTCKLIVYEVQHPSVQEGCDLDFLSSVGRQRSTLNLRVYLLPTSPTLFPRSPASCLRTPHCAFPFQANRFCS